MEVVGGRGELLARLLELRRNLAEKPLDRVSVGDRLKTPNLLVQFLCITTRRMQ